MSKVKAFIKKKKKRQSVSMDAPRTCEKPIAPGVPDADAGMTKAVVPAKAEANVGPGKGLSGKIARHNMDKLHKFVKTKKMQKSIDFHNTTVSIAAQDQQLAETASPQLIKYLKDSMANDLSKIPFIKGVLTLAQKEPGLYHGFFQDNAGQVVEKFENQTIELVAKNMEIKNLYAAPTPADTATSPNPPTATETALAAHDRIDMVHNRIDNMEKQIAEPAKGVKTLKISFGDFSLELRKSVRSFVNDFRKSRDLNSDLIRKAISSWRRKNKDVLDIPNDTAAAKELHANWDEHQEGFSQIVYALQQLEKDDV